MSQSTDDRPALGVRVLTPDGRIGIHYGPHGHPGSATHAVLRPVGGGIEWAASYEGLQVLAEISEFPRKADVDVLHVAWVEHITDCYACLGGHECAIKDRLNRALMIGAEESA
ncbi:hypothetical protein SUDANB171_04816 [Streptomyces sp. enrichment culture]|uniref:hypothetical protein n=1 Tax=Streptomyces sp. enrichment culture TaxID=1795815 RepID=UPI003F5678B9